VLPELGTPKKGKVRDLYFSDERVIMVASDRVSAFDHVLQNLIPFKGSLLNAISIWAFENSRDIVPNALIETETVDCNMIVQAKMRPIEIEFIVRSYMWGSLAAAYETGQRKFCGLSLPDGLLRFQKLDQPIFTPTTKAPVGEHDENITFDDVVSMLGEDGAKLARETALKLFKRGTELFASRGLLLLDTKYEFGFDGRGVLHVIDEVNTPDSSRMCDTLEWESKFPRIDAVMKNTPGFRTVSDMLKSNPQLKIKEFSKQYVRDVLLEKGFTDGLTTPPQISEEEVVECSYRYIAVYERITGQKFQFPNQQIDPVRRLLVSMTSASLIKGCCAIILCGSDSDLSHVEKIRKSLDSLGIPNKCRICSAHKQPEKLEACLKAYNKSSEPLLFIGCAGGTDALSGTASFHSLFPVVSCPPDGMNNSCLTNPSSSSNAFILRPDNVAHFAAQMFGHVNEDFRQDLIRVRTQKVKLLEEADDRLNLQIGARE